MVNIPTKFYGRKKTKSTRKRKGPKEKSFMDMMVLFMKKVTHKSLMIWLSSQNFVGSSSIPRQRSQHHHQSFQNFTFISMETVSRDITALLYHI